MSNDSFADKLKAADAAILELLALNDKMSADRDVLHQVAGDNGQEILRLRSFIAEFLDANEAQHAAQVAYENNYNPSLNRSVSDALDMANSRRSAAIRTLRDVERCDGCDGSGFYFDMDGEEYNCDAPNCPGRSERP